MNLSKTNITLVIVTIVAVIAAAIGFTRPADSPEKVQGHEFAMNDPCEVEPGTESPNYCEPSEPITPRNPVEILKKIPNCTTTAKSGETDIYGNRYADCTVPGQDEIGGYDVNVRTYPGDPALLYPEDVTNSDDGIVSIIGDDFDLYTSVEEVEALGLTPESLAKAVGGEIVPALP